MIEWSVTMLKLGVERLRARLAGAEVTWHHHCVSIENRNKFNFWRAIATFVLDGTTIQDSQAKV